MRQYPQLQQKPLKHKPLPHKTQKPQSKENIDNKFKRMQISNHEKEDILNFDIFTLFLRGFSQISFFSDNKDIWKQIENNFQNFVEQYSKKESVNCLTKTNKKWKNQSENEQIKLNCLLELCEYKSQFQVTQEIAPLERKISKDRKTFNVSQVCFLSQMQEYFASEEQFSKCNTFMFKCIENSSQLEFSAYFATFYMYILNDPYYLLMRTLTNKIY
ncbi:hypothetical protein TTHERM_00343910 (macronuclear) [Tetrahymena thermophila SB210]|uniref:Uncharacterized protein n=1 Tax=Tetrahymena thermophila (strain SB210) TaxID=312017 RepID=I7LVG6_TETTS|nr:hypothetical protein TTHERM_00343910 [Tetrahymena thermophila SB210]EAR98191.2 hypothetical protein TTHERM_00343910 [Tetrahymena thermophila SB210]|eukprot:XP_001018436.2 hypothetical protein TTHERM_00343910 [Tetrahymena thermophila SB210]